MSKRLDLKRAQLDKDGLFTGGNIATELMCSLRKINSNLLTTVGELLTQARDGNIKATEGVAKANETVDAIQEMKSSIDNLAILLQGIKGELEKQNGATRGGS